MAIYDARSDTSLSQALTNLGPTQSVTEFLGTVGRITLIEKGVIIDQAEIVIGQLLAHLPLKRTAHGINPLEELRVLRRRMVDMEDVSFQAKMVEIFKSLRDAHTNYTLMRPYNRSLAFLPFLLETYFENGVRRFLVSRVLSGFSHSTFKAGVELSHWNGIPVGRAVRSNADREEGSNDAARFAFGLAKMTVRGLSSSLPPDEEHVVVTYRTGSTSREILFSWRVLDLQTNPLTSNLFGAGPVASISGMDHSAESLSTRVRELHTARRWLFSPHISDRVVGKKTKKKKKTNDAANVDLATVSTIGTVLQFESYVFDGVDYGYIRIRDFAHKDIGDFLGEIARILELLPNNGVILDVRSNGGGFVANGELMLQFLTPKTIEPEPFQFIVTPLIRRLATVPDPSEGLSAGGDADRRDWADWGDSIQQAEKTGAVFSKGHALTPPEVANRFGQIYHGPVLLITDAQCYSTTDIFAAGFRDHDIGKILGVDANTGAGGANVVEHERHLRPMLSATDSPIQRLPKQTGMRVAIRRSLRVGPNSGQPLEDLGVIPDEIHEMTRNDLVKGNIDLITRALEMLSLEDSYRFDVSGIQVLSGTLSFNLASLNLDEVDIYVDGRPTHHQAVSDGVNAISFTLDSVTSGLLDLRGYAGNRLVAGRKEPF